MELTRRDFTKLLGAGIATGVTFSLLPEVTAMAASSESSEKGKTEAANTTEAAAGKSVLYDATKCIGCKLCEQACNAQNELPEGMAYTHVYLPEKEEGEDYFSLYAKHQCLHCIEPACVEACIVGALKKTPEGPVLYDGDVCIGCRYCMVACPFGVPTYEWEKTIPYIQKCTFCSTRLDDGMEPACVGSCPTRALQFGERDEMLEQARSYIAEEPDRYLDHIYGEHEGGGTSWLYLSSIPFDKIDLPELDDEPVITNTRRAMGLVLPVLVTVAATMTGVHFWTGRKKKKGNEGSEVTK